RPRTHQNQTPIGHPGVFRRRDLQQEAPTLPIDFILGKSPKPSTASPTRQAGLDREQIKTKRGPT
ncbi:MAG: hypothetical protein ACK57Y_15220, partial [Pirellulaceae bacterium]